MKRIKSLDLARGFTVLLIAPIHSMLLYSKPEVYASLIGQLFAFIAEGPGAPLFMMLMGISFALKENHRFSDVLKKATLLLLAGYGLNLVKFVIPYTGGWMPIGLQHDLQVGDRRGAWTLLGLGDILQFAGPALLILYGITRFRSYACIAVTLAITITWMAPLVWDAHSRSPLLNYFLQLTTCQPPRTFFPVFPWLAYPLLGLAIGHVLKRDGPSCFGYVGRWGIALIIIGGIFHFVYPNIPETTFYRTYPTDTAYHIGIVFIALYLWDLLYRYVKPNPFFRVLTYSSKHITLIYVIQWVLISLLLPLFGYQTLSLFTTVLVMIPLTITVYIMSALINAGRKDGFTI
jgi:surface polysaccharide O-acyltransferase-like enzyme